MNEILSKYTKTAAIAVFILLLVIAALWAYRYLYYTLPPQLVSITLEYQPESPCRKDSPLYMQILNDSYRDVLGTSFALSVKASKDGDNIAQLLSNTYSTDTIIKAGKTHEGCWSFPKLYTNKHDPNELIYEVKRQVVRFGD
jgi:hypothetical protein